MDLKNKTILITGATDGIGKQTAINAGKLGANIIVHGRNKKRVDEIVNKVYQVNNNIDVFGVTADFESLNEVFNMGNEINEKFSVIDILFNNAAEFIKDRSLTKDGFEKTFQVNHLSHFLLTELLLPLLQNSKMSKILNVTSMIHSSTINFDNLQGEKFYSGNDAYSLSKLLNILHTYKLADILENTSVKANCLHPGVIETKLLNAAWSGGMPVSEGAETLLYSAESTVTEQMSGLYLENRRPMQSNPISYDKEVQNKVWELSKKLLKGFL